MEVKTVKPLIYRLCWIATGVMIVLTGMQLYATKINFILFLLGMGLLLISYTMPYQWLKYVLELISLFILTLVLTTTQAFWGVICLVLILLIAFNTKQGNPLIWIHESVIHPFTKNRYIGVKVIRPMIEQRSRIYKDSILKLYQDTQVFEWEDINITAIGGDSIIDLGASMLLEGENVIIIRKIFGRIRIIIPRGVGVKLNVSLISGKVFYEMEEYTLLNDNLCYETEDYRQATRKLKIFVSSVTGNVEVIRI